MKIQEELQKPFEEMEIDWRVQSCDISKNNRPWVLVLAYVQARAIQKRLDEIFGWDGWTEQYRSVGNNMICRLGVKNSNSEWIYKENGASETQVEAFKGGISSAFKRVAASGFGIGRYLYDLEETFAKCTTSKPSNMQNWKKAKTKKGQIIYWEMPKLPKWALPQNINIEENLEDKSIFDLSPEQYNKNNRKMRAMAADIKAGNWFDKVRKSKENLEGKSSKEYTEKDWEYIFNKLKNLKKLAVVQLAKKAGYSEKDFQKWAVAVTGKENVDSWTSSQYKTVLTELKTVIKEGVKNEKQEKAS